jgi:hypothetical protein
MLLHCYSTTSFVQRSEDGDVESLLYFDSLYASCSFFYFCYVLDVFLRLLRNVIGVLFNPN